MKPILWIKKMLLGAVVTVIPVFIAACYGPAYRMEGYVTDSKTDESIPGIEVTCTILQKDDPSTPMIEGGEITVYTNENGYYVIPEGEPYGDCNIIQAKDVDGDENGVYMKKKFFVNFAPMFTGDIRLRRLD